MFGLSKREKEAKAQREAEARAQAFINQKIAEANARRSSLPTSMSGTNSNKTQEVIQLAIKSNPNFFKGDCGLDDEEE